MRILTLALMLGCAGALAAQQPAATNLAGLWEVDDQVWLIELEVTGSTVTGKVRQGNQEGVIYEGTVAGDAITFKVKSPDGARLISFTGKIAGDVIAFTRSVTIAEGAPGGGAGIMGGAGPMQFTARRASGDRWSGTIRNAPTRRNSNPNPNPRPASLSSRKMPDPHWRWRGGEKEFTIRTFAFANQSFQLDAFELNDDRLAYAYSRPGAGDEVKCELTRRPDGQFAGMCEAGSGGFVVLIELTPPGGLERQDAGWD